MKYDKKTILRSFLLCLLMITPIVGYSQGRIIRMQTQKVVVSNRQQKKTKKKSKISATRDVRPRIVPVGKTVTTDLHEWRLLSIELRNDETIAHWSVTSLQPNTGIWINNKIYIKDRTVGRIFKINGSYNIGESLARPRRLPYANQTVTFEIFFPVLPIGVTSVDYCMGERTISNIKLR